jgi:lipid II:glycine glycyltransferase (peptidoglycan interpeptide bridge formation enzyme)
MLTSHPIQSRQEWNTALSTFAHAHILQTWEWGEFKRVTTGWQPLRLAFKRHNALVGMVSLGVRSVGGLKLMYAPKGFVTYFEDATLVDEILHFLQRYARRNPTVWLKIDPDVVLATGLPNTDEDTSNPVGYDLQQALLARKWRFSDDQVQFRNSLCIDLTQSEDDILANMSQNTRRKVRTGEKKGVSIRRATLDDLPLLYALYQQTGERDAFLIRPFSYYQRAWHDFMQADLAHALIAEHEGQAIAHVILFHFGRKCWYFYGASSNTARETMPNYALQWEAMRWAKSQGYAVYDMWGAPNVFDESDSMWGVYEFKRGFRGVVTRHIGAWDYAPYAPLYWAYTRAVPTLRAWLRRGTSPSNANQT